MNCYTLVTYFVVFVGQFCFLLLMLHTCAVGYIINGFSAESTFSGLLWQEAPYLPNSVRHIGSLTCHLVLALFTCAVMHDIHDINDVFSGCKAQRDETVLYNVQHTWGHKSLSREGGMHDMQKNLRLNNEPIVTVVTMTFCSSYVNYINLHQLFSLRAWQRCEILQLACLCLSVCPLTCLRNSLSKRH